MLQDDLRYMLDNVNLPDDSVMKPLSIALCVRMKNALSQISFSKKTSGKVEIVKLPFEFNIHALTDAGIDPIEHDPVSHIMVVITDECVEKFKSYNPFTINFCGIYRTNKYGKFNVIFKIVK